MRTAIYVDGFNLYYWLKTTSYRWIDLKALAVRAITRPDLEHEVVAVKYFTAPVSDTYDDPNKALRQDTYIRALRAAIPELTVFKGEFRRNTEDLPRVTRNAGVGGLVSVWVTEEKGSDVNLAVELVNDAWLNIYDVAVVISNDSDLERAVYIAKKKGHTIINLVRGDAAFISLKRCASVAKMLSVDDLRNSLMPQQLPGTTIRIPQSWSAMEQRAGIR
jgi:uncharacterized LabA/DUF88 family protein